MSKLVDADPAGVIATTSRLSPARCVVELELGVGGGLGEDVGQLQGQTGSWAAIAAAKQKAQKEQSQAAADQGKTKR